jgi:hypothetical protein
VLVPLCSSLLSPLNLVQPAEDGMRRTISRGDS